MTDGTAGSAKRNPGRCERLADDTGHSARRERRRIDLVGVARAGTAAVGWIVDLPVPVVVRPIGALRGQRRIG
jgi:hypothetical protein